MVLGREGEGGFGCGDGFLWFLEFRMRERGVTICRVNCWCFYDINMWFQNQQVLFLVSVVFCICGVSNEGIEIPVCKGYCS